MTFEEWLNEDEGYSSRWERFLDDLREPIVTSMIKDWLEAAYEVGFDEGYDKGVNYEGRN